MSCINCTVPYLMCFSHLLGIKKKQEGATKEDIEQLSKFKFQRTENNEKLAGNTQGAAGGIMTECNVDSPIEHVLSDEDAVCCTFLLCVGIAFFSIVLLSFFALFVTRHYFKVKSMYVPNTGLVI